MTARASMARTVMMAKRELFEVSVLPHLSAMLRAASALVGKAEDEDAVQEALARAWRAWPGLRDTQVVRVWLLRITINVCREWHRGRFGRELELTRPLLSDEITEPDRWLQLDSAVGTSDHTGALDLRAAVSTLEEGLRLIVVLRFYAGMDATEIGIALDVPAYTIRTRLVRALDQLREQLGAYRGGRIRDPRGGTYA